MRPDETTPAAPGEPYADGPMYVEQAATPDGRLLLYFTFGHPDLDDRAGNHVAPSGAADADAGQRPERT